MSLTRCPQCGRVADGRSCFACGYEWPKGGAPGPAPASPSPAQAPAPAPAARTGPFSSPLAPPRAPTPQAVSVQQTGPLQRAMPAPSPFAQPPPTPGPSPFAQPPPTPGPSFGRAPSPSPFAAPPGPSPFAQPPPPPPPDEIVIDNDLEFSLMKDAIPPSLGNSLPPPPPGLPPPPMPSFPAPPPGLPPPPMPLGSLPPLGPPPAGLAPPSPGGGGANGTLDSLFDGIDIAVPTAPARMSDPALDAGDFMIDTGPASPPPPPPGDDPLGDTDWSLPSEASGPSTTDLGADLLAAFNATAGDAAEPGVDVGFGGGDDLGGLDISVDGLGGDNFGGEGLAQPPIAQRLSELAGRLRAEGRAGDADLVTEAMALINLQS